MALSERCRLLLACAFVLHCLLPTVHSQAQIWLSTGDSLKQLNREPDLWGSGGPVGGFNIDIDRGQVFQDIKGFGAALSNSASYLLWNSPNKDAALNDLFGSSGIGISYIRLVMGGSDFNAVPPYTYDDAGYEDFNQDQFSIAKDYDFVIPLIKDILRINPQVRIMASPWSAPAWMKDSNSLYGGTLREDTPVLQSLTEYFVRFVKAYAAEGITIDTITLQNEPEFDTPGYPTMRMPWYVQSNLIQYHLGPRFQQEGITTQIIIWDHNWDATWYPKSILDIPATKQYVAGTGWHCYAGNRYDPLVVQNAHPDRDLYFTECSGGEWDTHFGSVLGFFTQNLFIGQTRIGARAVLLWNLALDENFGPRVDVNGCTNCRGVLTIPSWGGYTKNVEYVSIGHFSKFVRPGARRIQSATYEADELESVAFQNPDGSVVVVVANVAWGETTKTFQIVVDGQWFYYENLPSRSVITFIK